MAYGFRRLSRALVLIVGIGAGSQGCGGSTAGASCEQDSDCSGGPKCLRDKLASNNTCVDQPGSGVCSLACTTHAQCAAYGSNFKCALSSVHVPCNPTGTCRENYSCSGACRDAPAK